MNRYTPGSLANSNGAYWKGDDGLVHATCVVRSFRNRDFTMGSAVTRYWRDTWCSRTIATSQELTGVDINPVDGPVTCVRCLANGEPHEVAE